MDIKLTALTNIPQQTFIELMNLPEVKKHMPLIGDEFSVADYHAFIAAKQHLWAAHGYGPYAILINATFAGWGGLQQEGEDVDLGLVLHPNFWGHGLKLLELFKKQAFDDMALPAITALLPTSRLNSRALRRLGFIATQPVQLNGHAFTRFCLVNQRP